MSNITYTTPPAFGDEQSERRYALHRQHALDEQRSKHAVAPCCRVLSITRGWIEAGAPIFADDVGGGISISISELVRVGTVLELSDDALLAQGHDPSHTHVAVSSVVSRTRGIIPPGAGCMASDFAEPPIPAGMTNAHGMPLSARAATDGTAEIADLARRGALVARSRDDASGNKKRSAAA